MAGFPKASHIYKARGNGPAIPVLAGSVFSQGDSRIPLLLKAGKEAKCQCNFWACWAYYIKLRTYNRWKKHTKRQWPIYSGA